MKYTKVLRISKTKPEDVFFLTAERNRNFFAEKLCVHNCDYQGEIKLRFRYLFAPKDLVVIDNKIFGKIDYEKIYKQGDRIAQIKPRKTEEIEFEIVNELPKIEGRKENGFGSTGN